MVVIPRVAMASDLVLPRVHHVSSKSRTAFSTSDSLVPSSNVPPFSDSRLHRECASGRKRSCFLRHPTPPGPRGSLGQPISHTRRLGLCHDPGRHHRPRMGARIGTRRTAHSRNGRFPPVRERRRPRLPPRGRSSAARFFIPVRRRAGADRRARPLPDARAPRGTELFRRPFRSPDPPVPSSTFTGSFTTIWASPPPTTATSPPGASRE